MELKLGYKQTEVGVIPEKWDVQPFENLAYIQRGKFTARPRNDPKYYGGDIPFIQTGDVTNARGRIRSEEHTSELQSRLHLVCRLLLEKKKNTAISSAHV